MWEFPAGLVETREKLVDSVKREFREEIGFELEEPRFLTSVFVSPSKSGQRAHIFTGYVGKRSKQQLDDSEDLTVKFVPKKDVWKLLKTKASSVHLLAYLLAREEGLLMA